MKNPLGNLMKQAQQMQADMQKAQEEMASMTVTGESGGGMVRITMTCKHQVRGLEIDDSLVGDDKEMLEDLIAAACNDASQRIAEKSQASMSAATAGIPLPPGFKLPF